MRTVFTLAFLLPLALAPAITALGGTYFGHPENSIAGGARWDAAPRTINGNERSLAGGLRYSVQGGSFEAYRDLIPWLTVPTVAEFQQAIEQAFAAWESADPVTGLGTDLYFVADLATPVAGSGNFEEGNPNGAEIDLLALDGGPNGGGRAFWGTIEQPVTLTSGIANYPGSEAIAGADITINIYSPTIYSLESFRRLLTHEIGHTLGLGDVDTERMRSQFIDDNYDGTSSATALATLTNSWALSVNPMNPAASPLSVYEVPNADPGTKTPGVDILMESSGLGISPTNPTSHPVPLRNDDYGMRQFLYPSLTFDHLPGDFNRDGAVDTADYVTWRNELGSRFAASDYAIWRTNYGAANGGGSKGAAAVPEPGSLPIILWILSFCLMRRRAFTNIQKNT